MRIEAGALALALREEVLAQADRWVLWTPVAFGAGAAAYFALKAEPPLWIALATAIIGLIGAGLVRRRVGNRAVIIAAALLAFAAGGFAIAKLKAAAVAAPVIPAGFGVATVEGWVVDVTSPSAERGRLLIAPIRISGLTPDQTPALIRTTVNPGQVLGPGSAVRFTAILDPPPGPASPGAYDFAREAWFERLGGVGKALTAPEVISLPRPTLGLRLQMALNAFRWSLAQRLAADVRRMTGDDAAAGLAAAVSTSHQSWLPEADATDLRNSGLAHMLAIAGLHTAAVSGFVFAFIRLSIAAWPWLALRVSGKKLAAAGGLIAVAAYLAVSGAHPPARRAAITAAVAFLAILFERRAISLRSLAVAALIILLLQPEAIVQPGFQMSFSATASLVALAEIWPRRAGPIQAPWFLRWPQRLKDWLIAMFFVSLVAGAATGPFAIQHFNRIASWGLFANLAADFVATAVLMPSLVLSGLAEAFGAPGWLAAPFLAAAGSGAHAVLAVAHLFATAPAALETLPSAPAPALLISFLGILFACLWKGRLRWIGVPLAAAVALWPRPAPPSAWIAADGNNAAVAERGRAIALKPEVRSYATETWAQRRGFILPVDPEIERDLLYDCDRKSCAPKRGTAPAIAAWWSRTLPKDGRLAELCGGAEILILRADVALPPQCGSALVFRAEDFARGGSAELYRSGPGRWRVVWAEPIRGARPWTLAGEARELGGSDE